MVPPNEHEQKIKNAYAPVPHRSVAKAQVSVVQGEEHCDIQGRSRDAKPLQNRTKDVLLQFSVACVGAHATRIPKGRPVDLFIVPNETEIGQQILPSHQNQRFPVPAAQIP